MVEMKRRGVYFYQIAERLNERGVRTATGRGKWGHKTVERMVMRAMGREKAAAA
jgi:hypothetical protein